MTGNPRPPHKHHFIPQFWSKNWAGCDGLVQRYTMPVRGKVVTHRRHPASIGWVDKLYEFPHYNRTLLNFEAILFKRIDQRAADLFVKLLGGSTATLDEHETEALAVFLMTLLHRTPAGIAAMRKLSRLMLDDIREDLRPRYGEIRGPNDPATVEEYEASLSPDSYLDHFSSIYRTVVLSENVGLFLANLRWRKMIFGQENRPILLSDDPLIRTNGIAISGGHLALPLSPRIVLVGAPEKHTLEAISSQPPKEVVKAMNRQIVESARHFVVDIDERQFRFISNRFGRNLRPTISEQSLRSADL